MQDLTFTIIKTRAQYNQYCSVLEEVLLEKKKTRAHKDTAELLTLLIEKWDNEHGIRKNLDPVELLKYLMEEHNMRSVILSKTLHISVSLVSDILNYRRGLSKEIIRRLSEYFKVSQELFNKPYALVEQANKVENKSKIKV